MNNKTYSIVIADDHVLIARALTVIIETFRRYHVLYEVEDGKGLQEHFRDKRKIPDIVLLDIIMKGIDGYETAAWLKTHHPEIKILALSSQDDEQSIIKMLKAGASGYLLKDIEPSELEKALDSLMEKGFYNSDIQYSRVISHVKKEDDAKANAIVFTDKEKKFLSYVATELNYKEIGQKMFCSSRTVEGYRDDIYAKLGIKTRVGLVVYAIKNGLIKI